MFKYFIVIVRRLFNRKFVKVKDESLIIKDFRRAPSVKHLQKEYSITQFIYNRQQDGYTCPVAETLTTLGTWHYKKGEAGETSYRFKTWRTHGCKGCSLKKHCSKLNKRIIHRSGYQDTLDRHNENIRNNPVYYKRRQSICEHPFGTIKRQWDIPIR